MWAYLATTLGWSAFGLFAGGLAAELGWDLRVIIRNSGRRNDDHT